jgi:hypothetical protein
MALRDQPYLPLYVQDFLTDEKLNMCSASTQGVYIKIMCLFHKSENYGGILLKQKDKQKSSDILNFALKFAKLLPFDLQTISSALNELIDEEVLKIEGNFIFQKRMINDYNLSIERAKSGSKGGKNTQNKYKNFALAKNEANTEYENEYKNEDVNIIERESNFKKKLFEFSEYPENTLIDFFNYWSQHGEKDKKMLFEKQKSFEISKRLITWIKNEHKFNGKNKPNSKTGATVTDLIEVTAKHFGNNDIQR